MADHSLRFPPFTPPNTFMCCLCFELTKVEDAYVNDDGEAEDVCKPCAERDSIAAFCIELTRMLGHPFYASDCYRKCMECGNVYMTAADLIEADRIFWNNYAFDQPPASHVDANNILSCPRCTHDF